jgi:hypothetical protein
LRVALNISSQNVINGEYLKNKKRPEITTLRNEISPLPPEVKLGDCSVFFCADCRPAIRFAISSILSEKQAHLE